MSADRRWRSAPTADVRLVGFNAPETTRARCPEERALGETADRRLREIVRGGDSDFAFVACSCRPGTADTALCNYRRKCGTLKASGRDVGDILVPEELAVPFDCAGLAPGHASTVV
jgi:endonuclease YncB( thermonuclease family)